MALFYQKMPVKKKKDGGSIFFLFFTKKGKGYCSIKGLLCLRREIEQARTYLA
jgi:hypothetical protein